MEDREAENQRNVDVCKRGLKKRSRATCVSLCRTDGGIRAAQEQD